MIIAILQARMSSSRLPGKVLKPILGKPMLLRQVERLRRASTLERLVIATSDNASDDPIAELCAENGIDCFRGSLMDVLDRFYQASKNINPDYVVRLTADCPLCDPMIIDQIVNFGVTGGFDYATNAINPTFPDGLDVEIMRFGSLEMAWKEAKMARDREHVTPFIHRQPERFKIGHYMGDQDLSGLRWTVDEPIDFALVTRVYKALYPLNPEFSTEDILQLLEDQPELKTLNSMHKRNVRTDKVASIGASTGNRG